MEITQVFDGPDPGRAIVEILFKREDAIDHFVKYRDCVALPILPLM